MKVKTSTIEIIRVTLICLMYAVGCDWELVLFDPLNMPIVRERLRMCSQIFVYDIRIVLNKIIVVTPYVTVMYQKFVR